MDNTIFNTLASLGIIPNNKNLYETAFTHRSYLNEFKQSISSNETLEFLGDSVLSFIVSTHLYRIRPEDTEGDLTNLRAYMVKSQALAKAASNLFLGNYLRLSKGEELSGGRDNQQLLANSYEALLGAVYLDLGIDKASEFVHKTLLPIFETEIKTGAPKDAKSTLQEYVQAKFQKSPRYKIIQAVGPDHAKKFTLGVFLQGEMIGQGGGNNKHEAEENAALMALDKLKTQDNGNTA